MNWKKFKAECRQVADFLAAEGYYAADLIIVRAAALMLESTAGLSSSEILWRALRPRVNGETIEFSTIPAWHMPEEVSAILGRWAAQLPNDPIILGEIYEHIALDRRSQGRYYTPREVIEFILHHTLDHADVLENPDVRVLDPACGCGFFLLFAFDRLWIKFTTARDLLTERFPDRDWSDTGIRNHILTHNLWGADIDPTAAEVAQLGLLFKSGCSDASLMPHIIVCDSLRRTSAASDFWSARYDYVIGNPPYLSFGLRGARSMDPDYRRYLRQEYSDSAQYKLSYYVLFMQRGIEMLSEGGRLGYIVPDSFLLGRYYSKIRRYILDNTAIELVACIDAQVFQNASVGKSTICVVTKQTARPAGSGHCLAVYRAADKADLLLAAPVCHYEQDYFERLPHNRFRIFFDLTGKNLIDKIDCISLPLEKYASGHTGLRALNRQSDLIGEEPCGSTWFRGIISGRQVNRYHVSYEGHWLNIDPSLLYKGGWRLDVVDRRKILMRQTGFTLTAAIDDEQLYHLNNVHSFVLRDESITLDYLLILLDSQLMSFYYHMVSMEYGRPMAQTDIDSLELLPIRVNLQISRQAPELVKAMNDAAARARRLEPGAAARVKVLDDFFDQLVFRIYDLSDDDIAYIKDYERKLRKSSQTGEPLDERSRS